MTSGGPDPRSNAATLVPPEGFAWVFLRPEDLPGRWYDRSVGMVLVPLLPEEATQLLEEGHVARVMRGDEERVAGLIAAGASPRQISRELEMPLRNVERRLARLRERYGVRSTAELTALFSRAGFDPVAAARQVRAEGAAEKASKKEKGADAAGEAD